MKRIDTTLLFLACALLTIIAIMMCSTYNQARAVTIRLQDDTSITPPVTAVKPLVRKGAKYRACILYRESRGNYKAHGAGGSGAYQFTQASWNITAKRAGWHELVNKRPYQAKPWTQDAMYYAAWEQGNGRFYWSARWNPAAYGCFPKDTAPVPARWR